MNEWTNQNLCLAPPAPHLTALSPLSCDCLCGVEAELILGALLTASASCVLMKWFSLRPPPLMAPQVLPGCKWECQALIQVSQTLGSAETN